MPQRRRGFSVLMVIGSLRIPVAVASLWLISNNAFSQDDTTRVLGPVSVLANADSISRITVITSAVPHFVLNEDKLRSLAVTDIGSAIKYIPGAQLKDYGGIGGIKTV